MRFAAERLQAEAALMDEAVRILGGLGLDRYLPRRQWELVGLRPHIRDPDLIMMLLPQIQLRADINERYDIHRNPFRAAGRLESNECRSWLLSIAQQGDLWDKPDLRGHVDAPTCAKAVLADLCEAQHVGARVDQELDLQLAKDGWLFVGRLDAWPRPIVRERLLSRLQQGQPTRNLTWLFSRYSGPEDREVLRTLEASDDVEVADIAHQRIRWEGFIRPSSPGQGAP